MATDIRISLPDDLRQAIEAAAKAEGKTVEELAQLAMQRDVAQRTLDRLQREGEGRRHGMTDQDVELAIENAVTDYRRGR